MTRALFVLLALLCGGCAEDTAEKWLSKDPINTAAVQRVERKVDSLRADFGDGTFRIIGADSVFVWYSGKSYKVSPR